MTTSTPMRAPRGTRRNLTARESASLRATYDALPSGRKWSTYEGQMFLERLHRAAAATSYAQLARALGLSPQAVQQLLARRETDDRYINAGEDVRRIRNAWALVCRRRASGAQVRRHHATYHRMHDALMRALTSLSLQQVAAVTGVPAPRLRHFLAPKSARVIVDDEQLLDLVRCYRQGQASKPRSRHRGMFLRQLHYAVEEAALTPAMIAAELGVSCAQVRAWLSESPPRTS